MKTNPTAGESWLTGRRWGSPENGATAAGDAGFDGDGASVGFRGQRGHEAMQHTAPRSMGAVACSDEVRVDGAVRLEQLGLRRDAVWLATSFPCTQKSPEGMSECARTRGTDWDKRGAAGTFCGGRRGRRAAAGSTAPASDCGGLAARLRGEKEGKWRRDTGL